MEINEERSQNEEVAQTQPEEEGESKLERHLENELRSLNTPKTEDEPVDQNNQSANELHAAPIQSTKLRISCFILVDFFITLFYLRFLNLFFYWENPVIVLLSAVLVVCLCVQITCFFAVCFNKARYQCVAFTLNSYKYVQRFLVGLSGFCFVSLTLLWIYIMFLVFVESKASPFFIPFFALFYLLIGGFFFAQMCIVYQSQGFFARSLWELRI